MPLGHRPWHTLTLMTMTIVEMMHNPRFAVISSSPKERQLKKKLPFSDMSTLDQTWEGHLRITLRVRAAVGDGGGGGKGVGAIPGGLGATP